MAVGSGEGSEQLLQGPRLQGTVASLEMSQDGWKGIPPREHLKGILMNPWVEDHRGLVGEP